MRDDNFYNKVTNSRFYSLGDKIGDMMIMSLLWLVFCIPVVTFIPSTAALYYTVFRKHEKHSGSPKDDFLRSFKANLKQGIIINIIYILYSRVVAANMFVSYFGLGNIKLPDFCFPASFILLIPIIFTMPFVITCLARFENTTIATFKNGFTLSTMYLFTTIKIWLICLISTAVMISFFPSALLLPPFSMRIIEKMVESIYKYALNQESNRNNDNTVENNASMLESEMETNEGLS